MLTLRVQRWLLKIAFEYSWITTYLGKKPPTVRQDQAVSIPRCPRVLRSLVHELKPFEPQHGRDESDIDTQDNDELYPQES
jgi:hypothetical protein